MQFVYSDIFVAPVVSHGGAKYGITSMDGYLKYSSVYLLRRKDTQSAFNAFVEFKNKYENVVGTKMQVFRTDRGGEYFNVKLFRKHLIHWGIQHQSTLTYTSSRNGVIERLNLTLLDTTRVLLYNDDGNADRKLW